MIKAGGYVEKNFNKDTLNSKSVNEEVLFKILSQNRNCRYGKNYDFASIKTIEEFKSRVPITEYLDYEKYISQMLRGEFDILVKGDVKYFGHTSGTTGKQKLIPVTKKSRNIAAKYMALLNQKYSYNNFKEQWEFERGLMLADVVMSSQTEGGLPICSATSGGMKSIRYIIPKIYTSPYEVMEVADKSSSLYLHLLFALEEKNLFYISGVFISSVLDLLRVLENKWDYLVVDVKRGYIDKKLNIDEEKRKKLNKFLRPNASRASELELEFKKGFQGICKRIWPKLTYIATVTGANFSIYDEKVNYYTGNLPIYSPAYAATEGMIGINPNISKIRYIIIPDTVFYEFIPVSETEKSNPKTYLINELEIGGEYEILVTNYAGFYRYRLGDVVKVINYYNNSPEIEFLYRKNQVLNMVSEKTTEDHLKTAVNNTMKKLNLALVDYTTLEDNSITPGRYIFYFEFNNKLQKSYVEKIEEYLELELQKANLAYGRFRNGNRLGMVGVRVVNSNTFNEIKYFLISKGASKSQVKIPRVVTNNEDIVKILNYRCYINK